MKRLHYLLRSQLRRSNLRKTALEFDKPVDSLIEDDRKIFRFLADSKSDLELVLTKLRALTES